MLLSLLNRNTIADTILRDLDRLQNQFSCQHLPDFYNHGKGSVGELNVYSKDGEAVITLIAPGYSTDDIEISAKDESLEISGKPQPVSLDGQKEIYHEINLSGFKRRIEIGFRADSSKTEAIVRNGILTIRLFQSEDAKPKKIEVKSC